jgi:hypothetical protein
MKSKTEEIRAEYAQAKKELTSMQQNRARASLRGDSAIARSYDDRIAQQIEVMARIERRLFNSVANDNML